MNLLLHIIDCLLRGWLPALLFFIAVIGTGCCFLPKRWSELESPWPLCIAATLGWHFSSLLILLVGTTAGLNAFTLIVFFVLPLVAATGWALATGKLAAACSPLSKISQWWSLGWAYKSLLLMCLAVFAVMFAVASTPPTKHDDLYYHLLFPARALIEGRLNFYASPWLIAMPHQSYGALEIVLLHFGKASATIAFGFFWGLLATVAVFELVRQVSVRRAALCTSVFVLGFSNTVWWVSASSSSISILFCCLLVIWSIDGERLRTKFSLTNFEYYLVASIFAAALCTSKFSFLVPASLILLALLVREVTKSKNPMTVGVAIVTMAATFAALYCPWLWFCYQGGGTPFGIVAVNLFGSRVFDPNLSALKMEGSRLANQRDAPALIRPFFGLFFALRETAMLKQANIMQPLFALVLGPAVLVYRRQWELLVALLLGSYFLGVTVSHDLRFHAIFYYGMLVGTFMWCPASWLARVKKFAVVIVLLLSLPSLAAAIYYSALFWPVALGVRSEHDFLSKHSGFYTVFDWCNLNLPRSARLCLLIGGHPRGFYLQRFLMFPERTTKNEVAENHAIEPFMKRYNLGYVLSDHELPKTAALTLLRRFDDIVTHGSRQPGVPPEMGTAWLYRRTEDPSNK